jgi:diadenosine tetraphosphate (Ap4A) HIT family hydrolase
MISIVPSLSRDAEWLGRDIERELKERSLCYNLANRLGRTTRIMAETKNVALLPTLSPVVPNHCLLFSKRAAFSFKDLTAESAEVAAELFDLTGRFTATFGESLRFEHGATADGLACGVYRAHVHLIPQRGIDVELLISSLKQELGEPEILAGGWLQSPPLRTEYLAIQHSSDRTLFWKKNSIPSQLVRRRICDQLLSNDWDWKQLSGWPEIKRTLSIWMNTVERHAS